MRYIELFEYNQQKTIDNYRNELSSRIENDHSVNSVEEVITRLEEADPSKKKAFVIQLLKWYLSGSMRFTEDAYKATEPLLLYAKFRNRGLTPLNQMTFGELLDLGDELSDTKSNTEMNKEEEEAFYTSGQAKLISDTPEWKVVIPKTKEAAIYFGRNTQWCTSATNNNMFDYYNKDGSLYIVLFKKENKRYQIHFESGQYMTEKDQRITVEEGKRIFDGPMKKYQKIVVQRRGSDIQYIDNPSKELQLLAVQINKYNIKYIDNPSEEAQIFSVKQDDFMISYIDNPSEEVQKIAIQEYEYNIQYIDNPSEELQRLAVQQNSAAIKYIGNPCEEIIRLAVQQDGDVIKWIKNPSEEVKKLAVQQNGYAIQYINNPSEDVQRLAVQQNGSSIKYIDNPSEEIKRLAVQQDGWSIQHIKNPSEEIQRLAVKQDGYAIKYIDNPSDEVKRIANQNK